MDTLGEMGRWALINGPISNQVCPITFGKIHYLKNKFILANKILQI